MTRETLIKKTIDNLSKLPDQKLKEVSDFAEFLLNRIENQLMTEGIQKLVSDSKAFKFLEAEEDLYSVDDLKEKYKWKRGHCVITVPIYRLSGIKNRPALILAEGESDITVSFITTQLKWQEDFDVKIEPSQSNGLKRISLIRLSKLATIDKDLVIGRLGNLSHDELSNVDKNLVKIFKLVP